MLFPIQIVCFSILFQIFDYSCSNGHKNECDDFNGEEAYIQDSPSEVSYATTTEALGKDTQIVPAPQYNYARTGGIKVKRIQSKLYIYKCTYTYVHSLHTYDNNSANYFNVNKIALVHIYVHTYTYVHMNHMYTCMLTSVLYICL